MQMHHSGICLEVLKKYRRRVSTCKIQGWDLQELLKENEILELSGNTWVKVFRIIPEFRIFRLTFHRKSASKY